jgi:hypothetical protein
MADRASNGSKKNMQSHLRMMTSVDYGLQIVTATGGIRRINDTIRILKDGRNQGYMQEWLNMVMIRSVILPDS